MQVFRAEVMAPFADAMRLIHDEQRGFGCANRIKNLRFCELLGREEKELEIASLEVFKCLSADTRRCGRVHDGSTAGVQLVESFRLVFLKCYEGGDYDRRARESNSRNLING